METSGRRRKRVNPQHDAEHYIKLKTDKTGLTEQFISPCKGIVVSFVHFDNYSTHKQ